MSNQVIASTTGIFSGPYFPAFGLTTGRYRVDVLEKRCFIKKLLKKETPIQLISCEYCKFFKNIFFYRTPAVAASGKKTSSRKKRCIGTLSNIFDVASF